MGKNLSLKRQGSAEGRAQGLGVNEQLLSKNHINYSQNLRPLSLSASTPISLSVGGNHRGSVRPMH
jgi:hypothetical protein